MEAHGGRDPRIDPKPGDVLRIKRMGGAFPVMITRVVCKLHVGYVLWRVGDFGYDATLEEWRKEVAGAEIVKVAGKDVHR